MNPGGARPRVVYIAYHFAPAPEIGARRSTVIVQDLAAAGIDSTVISSFGGANDPAMPGGPAEVRLLPLRLPRKWLLGALARLKQRVRSWLSGPAPESPKVTQPAKAAGAGRAEPVGYRHGFLTRLAMLVDDYKLWSWRAARLGSDRARRERATAVVCSGPPMSQLIAGWWISRRRGIPLIADLRDGWITGSDEDRPVDIAYRISRWFEGFVLARAHAVVVTADGLARLLVERYPALRDRMHVVRNGFDGEPRRPPVATAHQLRILFTGEIYARRNPFGFLEALDRLVQRPDVDASRVSATFVGGCEHYRGQNLREWLSGRKVEGIVKILPPVPASEAARMAQEATVLLNFAQGSPYTIPAKSYDYMASGRELLFLAEADGDTGRLFAGIRGVLRVDPADVAQIESALADLYQRHVVAGISTVPSTQDAIAFSRREQNKAFVKLVASQVVVTA